MLHIFFIVSRIPIPFRVPSSNSSPWSWRPSPESSSFPSPCSLQSCNTSRSSSLSGNSCPSKTSVALSLELASSSPLYTLTGSASLPCSAMSIFTTWFTTTARLIATTSLITTTAECLPPVWSLSLSGLNTVCGNRFLWVNNVTSSGLQRLWWCTRKP